MQAQLNLRATVGGCQTLIGCKDTFLQRRSEALFVIDTFCVTFDCRLFEFAAMFVKLTLRGLTGRKSLIILIFIKPKF